MSACASLCMHPLILQYCWQIHFKWGLSSQHVQFLVKHNSPLLPGGMNSAGMHLTNVLWCWCRLKQIFFATMFLAWKPASRSLSFCKHSVILLSHPLPHSACLACVESGAFYRQAAHQRQHNNLLASSMTRTTTLPPPLTKTEHKRIQTNK